MNFKNIYLQEIKYKPMKLSSPSLFRFVFWVFIIYSVLLRQYLWLNYSYLTNEREQVRVKDVLLVCGKCQYSKYNFLFTNISAKNIDFLGKDTETNIVSSPREVVATGILEYRVTGNKFSGLSLREAQIDQAVSRSPVLIAAFISLKGWADRVVEYFGFSIGRFFSQDESALIQGLLTGRLDGVGANFYNKLQDSGLLHLAAASGYNITMVISLGWGLSFWILPRRLMKYFVTFFVTLFIFVSNFSPSVVRAGIMGLSGFWAAEISGSGRSAGRIFLATGGLLLLLFPGWLYDIGFQLSFSATAGMLWLEPRIYAKVQECTKKHSPPAGGVQEGIKKLSESLAANLSVAPVLIWHFGWKQFGLWGVLLNIPASFLVGPLMGLGLLILIFESSLPVLAKALAIAGKPLLLAMIWLIEIGARLK